MFQRNEVQREFGDVSFSEHAVLFQNSIADERPSWYPYDCKVVICLRFTPDKADLLCNC